MKSDVIFIIQLVTIIASFYIVNKYISKFNLISRGGPAGIGAGLFIFVPAVALSALGNSCIAAMVARNISVIDGKMLAYGFATFLFILGLICRLTNRSLKKFEPKFAGILFFISAACAALTTYFM